MISYRIANILLILLLLLGLCVMLSFIQNRKITCNEINDNGVKKCCMTTSINLGCCIDTECPDLCGEKTLFTQSCHGIFYLWEIMIILFGIVCVLLCGLCCYGEFHKYLDGKTCRIQYNDETTGYV